MTTETAHAAFGWCLSGDHRACRKTFTLAYRTTTCGCWCHRKDDTDE